MYIVVLKKNKNKKKTLPKLQTKLQQHQRPRVSLNRLHAHPLYGVYGLINLNDAPWNLLVLHPLPITYSCFKC